MIKSSPLAQAAAAARRSLLALAVLAVAAAALWLGGPAATGGDGGSATSVAVTQGARRRCARRGRGRRRGFRPAGREPRRRSSSAASALAADGQPRAQRGGSPQRAELWRRRRRGLDRLASARARRCSTCMPRATQLLELAPQLLARTGNLVSALPPADLETNQPYLERFELTVESIQQSVRAFGAGADDRRCRAAARRRGAISRADHSRSCAARTRASA